jgi:hypothetical protein
MQKRIEEFIKVATERNADPAMYRLYQQLVGLCAEYDRKKLHVAWNELTTKKELAQWDEDFLEETINPSPAATPAPAGFNRLQQGPTSVGGTGGNSALAQNNYYGYQTTISAAQAQAANIQAKLANQHMNDYYNQLHRGTTGTEKPASYYDIIKSALGI